MMPASGLILCTTQTATTAPRFVSRRHDNFEHCRTTALSLASSTISFLDWAHRGSCQAAPLGGYRVGDHWLDLIHLEGFDRDCFAWRKWMSSLIVSENALVQHQMDSQPVTNEPVTNQPAAPCIRRVG